jgi:hypothetical protein
VFLDGESVGFTPIELRLARDRDHQIELRVGDQRRSFVLQSDVQGAMIGLDLVPVGLLTGTAVVFGALASAVSPDGSSSATAAGIAVVGVSLVPILVDFGTGAVYRLNPSEVLAVFE